MIILGGAPNLANLVCICSFSGNILKLGDKPTNATGMGQLAMTIAPRKWPMGIYGDRNCGYWRYGMIHPKYEIHHPKYENMGLMGINHPMVCGNHPKYGAQASTPWISLVPSVMKQQHCWRLENPNRYESDRFWCHSWGCGWRSRPCSTRNWSTCSELPFWRNMMSHRLNDLVGVSELRQENVCFTTAFHKRIQWFSPPRLSSGFLLDVALHILAEFPRYLGINLGCALAGLRTTLRRDIFDGYVGLKPHNIQTFRVYISIMSGFTTWYQVLTLYPGYDFSQCLCDMSMYLYI